MRLKIVVNESFKLIDILRNCDESIHGDFLCTYWVMAICNFEHEIFSKHCYWPSDMFLLSYLSVNEVKNVCWNYFYCVKLKIYYYLVTSVKYAELKYISNCCTSSDSRKLKIP